MDGVHAYVALLMTDLAPAYCLGVNIPAERNPPMTSSKGKLCVRSFPYPQFPFYHPKFPFLNQLLQQVITLATIILQSLLRSPSNGQGPVHLLNPI